MLVQLNKNIDLYAIILFIDKLINEENFNFLSTYYGYLNNSAVIIFL